MTTKGLNHHKRRLGSKDPRVTSSQTFTSTNPRGEHKPMQQCNGKNTRSAQVLHSQIPPKVTNACGGRREEEQRRTQQMELQDQDLLGSPHLEERWICRIVDLDLLSLSLKDMQEPWEELGEGKLSKVDNGGGERGKTCLT